ncbi:ornithine cyclodeaminase family protein [Metallosphaera tengchongensis]|uniref:Ornithine cyclodeaminase family protein n=1 Tax=Metallosphaera tengchongensis TaxID=1532350 RepID=A0A6N0NRQ1_9CREN|nr:ornithine cyclodeaminase family protein [Metallosphaera tengchongensis]QKQ99435.1 ornithine cyclodeaminase family protein [Metallosphaera tengchongensis]
MRVFSDQDLIAALTPATAVEAMREAFSLLKKGEAEIPPRAVLTVNGNWWGVMPCKTKYAFTVKVVAVIPENRARGLPAVNGSVLVMSPETAEPLALVPGSTLTAIRTAATSVLSTELAVGRRVETLGVIGGGMEAEFHVRTALGYLSVGRVLISARKSHVELAKKVGGEAVDLEYLLRNSDVIFSTTSSTTPVVKGALLKDGFHVVSIGAHTPEARELDDDVVRRAKTFVADSLDAVSRESGDFIEPKAKGLLQGKEVTELGEVLERGSIVRPSIFKSVGVAVQDNLASYYALKYSD